MDPLRFFVKISILGANESSEFWFVLCSRFEIRLTLYRGYSTIVLWIKIMDLTIFLEVVSI